MITNIEKCVDSNEIQEMVAQEYDLQEFTFKWDQHYIRPDATRTADDTGAGSGIYSFGSPVFTTDKSPYKWRVRMDVIPSGKDLTVSCMLVEQCGDFGWGPLVKHYNEDKNDFNYGDSSPTSTSNLKTSESYFKFKFLEYKNDTITTLYKVVIKSKKDASISRSIKNLWAGENSNLSDAILRTPSKKEFHVHRILLASRSPVFAAMFRFGSSNIPNLNVEENNTDKIVVDINTDAEDDAVAAMLEYIYTGGISEDHKLDFGNLDEKTKKYIDILMLADMFDLPGLKVYSEAYIWKDVHIENDFEIHKHATLYNASNLKAETLEFIRTYPNTVMSPEERFELLRQNSPQVE